MARPVIIEIRRTGYEKGQGPKWQMRVLAHDGLLIDSTFASTRWGAWRMAKSSWRQFTKAGARTRKHLDAMQAEDDRLGLRQFDGRVDETE